MLCQELPELADKEHASTVSETHGILLKTRPLRLGKKTEKAADAGEWKQKASTLHLQQNQKFLEPTSNSYYPCHFSVTDTNLSGRC